ncbi:MAG: DUF2190 family protein [Sterolibacterium sp.]
MQNFVQEGNILTLTAPYTRTAGQAALIGAIFCVACNDVTSGASGEFARTGVYDLTALSTATGAMGAKAYWDDSNKRIDTDSTIGMLVGTLVTAKTNGQTTARVVLNGCAPSTAEGAQGAIVALTDNTGGSGTHDDTLADGLTVAAFAGGTFTGAVDGTVEDIAAAAGACAGNAEPSAANVDTAIATAVAPIVTGTNLQLAEIKAKVDALITDVTVQNQNDSDLAQKILEIRTALIAAGILTA